MQSTEKTESLSDTIWRGDGRRQDAIRRSNHHYPNYDFSNPKKGWKASTKGLNLAAEARRERVISTLVLGALFVVVGAWWMLSQ